MLENPYIFISISQLEINVGSDPDRALTAYNNFDTINAILSFKYYRNSNININQILTKKKGIYRWAWEKYFFSR